MKDLPQNFAQYSVEFFFLLIKYSVCIDPLITYIIWKYFFQFGDLWFHSLKSVFQRAEVLKLMNSNFLFLLFTDSEFVSYLGFLSSPVSQRFFSNIFSQKFYIFSISSAYCPFCVNLFYGVSYGSMLFVAILEFFCPYTPNFSSTICCKDHTFSPE